MALALKKEERYTLADVMAWDESERIELIEGETVFLMSPPKRPHQRAVLKIATQIEEYLSGKTCEVNIAPFGVRLFEKEGDRPEDVDTLVEPDISIVCDPAKLDDDGCKGAPDFIAEVLSPSNRRHDILTKFNLYQRAGVREYWLVDPEERTVQVFLLEGQHYVVKAVAGTGDRLKINVLEDCEIDLAEVFPADPAAAPPADGREE